MSFFLYKFYLNQNLIKHKILIFSKLKLNKSVNNHVMLIIIFLALLIMMQNDIIIFVEL